MITDPYTPTPPAVDHAEQTKLAAQIEAMNAAALLRHIALLPNAGQHRRSGVTTNKMQPRDKSRVKMARESKRQNRRKK